MKKALELALTLTKKHQTLKNKINQTPDYSEKTDLRNQQMKINRQVIRFLIELQDFIDFIKSNYEFEMMYTELIHYYFTQIHHQINIYEIELDHLEFESNFSIIPTNTVKNLEKRKEIKLLKKKLDSFYRLVNF